MENVTANLSFKKNLLKEIDWLAKKEGRSRSELIREAARIYITENREKHMPVNYFDINPERLNATTFEVAEQAAQYDGEHEIKRYTYADYMKWPDDERWELIDGIPYNMTPAPSSGHQSICMAISGELYQYLKGKPCKVFAAPFDVRFYFEKDVLPDGTIPDNAITNVMQPDIIVICDRKKIDCRGCIGSPEFAVEVLSKYTSQKDSIKKLNAYEKFGVQEFWMVRPEEKTVMVFKLDTDSRYGRPEIYGEEDTVNVDILPGFSLNLKDVFFL